jgi:hypothetical protein
MPLESPRKTSAREFLLLLAIRLPGIALVAIALHATHHFFGHPTSDAPFQPLVSADVNGFFAALAYLFTAAFVYFLVSCKPFRTRLISEILTLLLFLLPLVYLGIMNNYG